MNEITEGKTQRTKPARTTKTRSRKRTAQPPPALESQPLFEAPLVQLAILKDALLDLHTYIEHCIIAEIEDLQAAVARHLGEISLVTEDYGTPFLDVVIGPKRKLRPKRRRKAVYKAINI